MPDSPREVVRVIGYVPGSSLIVTMPTNKGKVKIVREGQAYKARMLLGDSVVGFEAKVLFVSLKPYPHMHLQYPKEFAQIIVRNKHTLAVEIKYTNKSFDINYKSSKNLNYSANDGKPRIHPNDNSWMQNINNDISSQLNYMCVSK